MKLCHSVGSLTPLPRGSLSLFHWPLDSLSSQLRVYITCIWGRDTTLEPSFPSHLQETSSLKSFPPGSPPALPPSSFFLDKPQLAAAPTSPRIPDHH